MKRVLIVCIALVAALSAGYAQTRYSIRSISYEIDGRTKQYFIERLTDIHVGQEFPDQESLAALLEDRRQLLINERVLESAEIKTMFAAADYSGLIPVDLVVATKDTFNIIGLPYGKYDSNTGLLLALRGRDYNFFGTMEPLILNVNWEIDNDGEHTPGLESKFTLPFRAAGLDWKWNLDAELTTPGWKDLIFSANTGLTASIPLWQHTLSLYALQSFDIGAEDSTGISYSDEFYFTSSIGTYYSWRILRTKNYGDLVVRPKVDLSYRWWPGGLTDASLLQTPVVTPSVNASIGRVNWKGNFREGAEASATLSTSYYVSEGSIATKLSGSTSVFFALEFFGPSAQLSGFTWLNGSIDTSAGDPVRGVLNSRIKTASALFLNLDLPFRLIRFSPADWFGISWMRYFHFEQHWSPFIDLALVEEAGRIFSPSDMWIGSGLEVITYPKVFRSFYFRISLAWDLRDVLQLRSLTGKSLRDGRGISEFFFGVGLHY
jgi:hypothetical protein